MKPLLPFDGEVDEVNAALADEISAFAASASDAPGSGPSPDEWERVAPVALALARRRRRRFLARELARVAGVRWTAAGIAVAASLFAVAQMSATPRFRAVWSGESFLPASGPPTVINSTRASPAHLRLASGASLVIAGSAQVEPAAGLLRLDAGLANLSIPRLASGHSFRVSTPEAEVTVHGTHFTVERTSEETRVTVQEGLVEIRALDGRTPTSLVRAGDTARVPSAGRVREELSRVAEAAVRESRCEGGASVRAFLEIAPPDFDVSSFHYFEGFCAYRSRSLPAALVSFEAAARTSRDPLRADNAAARAAQIRTTLDPSSTPAAWSDYLERFPQGIHRETAHRALSASGRR